MIQSAPSLGLIFSTPSTLSIKNSMFVDVNGTGVLLRRDSSSALLVRSVLLEITPGLSPPGSSPASPCFRVHRLQGCARSAPPLSLSLPPIFSLAFQSQQTQRY